MHQAKKITITHDPREDRLKLALVDAHDQTRVVWLTQRLASMLVPKLADSLDLELAVPAAAAPDVRPRAQVLAQTSADLTIAKLAPVKAAPRAESDGLLLGVTLSRSTSGFVLRLSWDGDAVQLSGDVAWLRQLLRIFHNSYGAAGWRTDGVFPDWFDSGEQRRLIGENRFN